MEVAVITGASSGLGREYVMQADRKGSFDQIWVIARRGDRLAELAAGCSTEVVPVELDLSDSGNIDVLVSLLSQARSRDASFAVKLLVCAAGFGKFGTYRDLSADETSSMIDVNCKAAVLVTQSVIPYMGHGSRIIEVASCAGFQPLPGLNVYAATKAFMISYTRSLRWELAGSGIHATAVCPPWMRTEFIEVCRDTANGKTVRHPFPVISPRRVATWSSFVNACNLPVATCAIVTVIHRVLAKFLPHPIIMGAWEGIRRI